MIRYTLDAAEQAADAEGIAVVSDIHIVVGELRAAVPEQMELAFEMLTRDHPLFEHACLSVEVRPVRLQCKACGHEFDSSLQTISSDRCTQCGSDCFEILSGRELYIDSFGGE